MSRPPVPSAGRKKFGGSQRRGLQLEYAFRRDYPLTEEATKELHQSITDIVSANRKRYSRFFASLLMTVLGGLYQVKFNFGAPDDDSDEWKHQWVSTPVVHRIDDLHSEVDTLLDDTIDFQVAERPAKLLRFRVVFLSGSRTTFLSKKR